MSQPNIAIASNLSSYGKNVALTRLPWELQGEASLRRSGTWTDNLAST